MRYFLLTVALLSSTLIASPCKELVGSCEYYQCLEEQVLTCGDEGYAVGYGKKYCEKFSSMQFAPHRTRLEEEAFPALGPVWRDRVRSCLMNELEGFLEEKAPLTCQGLRDFAFGSHPDCYTRSPSFCDLSLENATRVGLTIDPATILRAESITQIRQTAAICVESLTQRIEQAPSFAVKLQLKHARGLWRLVAKKPEKIRELNGFREVQ